MGLLTKKINFRKKEFYIKNKQSQTLCDNQLFLGKQVSCKKSEQNDKNSETKHKFSEAILLLQRDK